MQILRSNEKLSVYGSLNIKNCRKKSEKNICISVENKKLREISKYIYEFLDREYQSNDYDWDNISITTKTEKIVINGNTITEQNVNLYGYVKDCGGIPSERGKKYNFKAIEIPLEELIQTIDSIYDDYICDFDTIKDGLKMVLTKIELY